MPPLGLVFVLEDGQLWRHQDRTTNTRREKTRTEGEPRRCARLCADVSVCVRVCVHARVDGDVIVLNDRKREKRLPTASDGGARQTGGFNLLV